jgi:hypothetical protein
MLLTTAMEANPRRRRKVSITTLIALLALTGGTQALAPAPAGAVTNSSTGTCTPTVLDAVTTMYVASDGRICLFKIDLGGGNYHSYAPQTIPTSSGQPVCTDPTYCLPDSSGGRGLENDGSGEFPDQEGHSIRLRVPKGWFKRGKNRDVVKRGAPQKGVPPTDAAMKPKRQTWVRSKKTVEIPLSKLPCGTLEESMNSLAKQYGALEDSMTAAFAALDYAKWENLMSQQFRVTLAYRPYLDEFNARCR